MSYFKPRFNHKYPLNYVVLLFVFVGSFSISSIAFAFEDDGTWQSDKYWLYFNASGSSSGYSPTASGLCSQLGGEYDAPRFGVNFCGGIGYMYHEFCGSYQSTSAFINESGCGQFPEPEEPQDCADLQSQNPDPITMEYVGGYQIQFCNNGCVMKDSGTGSGDFGSYIIGDYNYTGGDCNGGFNADSGLTEIDTYSHDDDLQNCYDGTGKLIGQISVDLTCPSLDICYDLTTGKPIGTTSSSTSCENGGKYSDLTQDQKNALKTESKTDTSVILPDGTVTETTETTVSETGLDGTSTTETTVTETTTNPDGSTSTETTTEEKTTDCTGDKCTEKAIKNLDNCSESLQCSGDIFQCQQLRIEKDKACALTEDSLKNWVESDSFKDKIHAEIDGDGQLTALDGGTVDVSASLNVNGWMNDDGVTAACPAPIPAGDYFIDITPFCTFMDEIRAVVIFFNTIAIIWFFRRSLLEKD